MNTDSDSPEVPSTTADVPDRPIHRRVSWRRALEGFILGGLAGAGLDELVLQGFGGHLPLYVGLIGTALALTRLRPLVWLGAGGVLSVLLVLGYTPIGWMLVTKLDRADTLRSAPAIVVLGTGARQDGALFSGMQERALHGYLLARRGFAPRLVVTRPHEPAPAWDPMMRRQLDDLGLHQIVLDVVGPVATTHDEAVAIKNLMKENGWSEVILVTHPWHMRRAAAVFEKAGVRVICSSCVEGQYDLDKPAGPRDRIGEFRRWLYETVGYQVYRNRGWI